MQHIFLWGRSWSRPPQSGTNNSLQTTGQRSATCGSGYNLVKNLDVTDRPCRQEESGEIQNSESGDVMTRKTPSIMQIHKCGFYGKVAQEFPICCLPETRSTQAGRKRHHCMCWPACRKKNSSVISACGRNHNEPTDSMVKHSGGNIMLWG